MSKFEVCCYFASPRSWTALRRCFKSGSGVTRSVKVFFERLGIEVTTSVEAIRDAYIAQAKLYHPDTASNDESKSSEKFIEIREAYMECVTYAQGISLSQTIKESLDDDLKKIDRDLLKPREVAHRQFLSYDIGPGSHSERERAHRQLRIDRAVDDVFERKLQNSMKNSSEKSVAWYKQNRSPSFITHTLERLAEDFIKESMAKGDFENLKGRGKPLKYVPENVVLDSTSTKINEILANAGFTPEWITLDKEIRVDVIKLKKKIVAKWHSMGQKPLTNDDSIKWDTFLSDYCIPDIKDINIKIDKFNFSVPILSKQKVRLRLDIIFKNAIQESTAVYVVPNEHT